MKLTPLDIQHAEFGSAMSGYSKRQVREFLERVANELEDVLRENQSLRDGSKVLSEQIDELKGSEAELKRVVIAAERIATEIRDNAKQEAALTVQEAQQRSHRLLAETETFRQKALAETEQQRQQQQAETETKVQEARAELLRIEREQRLFREQFRALLQAFARSLESGPVALSVGPAATDDLQPAALQEQSEPDESGPD